MHLPSNAYLASCLKSLWPFIYSSFEALVCTCGTGVWITNTPANVSLDCLIHWLENNPLLLADFSLTRLCQFKTFFHGALIFDIIYMQNTASSNNSFLFNRKSFKVLITAACLVVGVVTMIMQECPVVQCRVGLCVVWRLHPPDCHTNATF